MLNLRAAQAQNPSSKTQAVVFSFGVRCSIKIFHAIKWNISERVRQFSSSNSFGRIADQYPISKAKRCHAVLHVLLCISSTSPPLPPPPSFHSCITSTKKLRIFSAFYQTDAKHKLELNFVIRRVNGEAKISTTGFAHKIMEGIKNSIAYFNRPQPSQAPHHINFNSISVSIQFQFQFHSQFNSISIDQHRHQKETQNHFDALFQNLIK